MIAIKRFYLSLRKILLSAAGFFISGRGQAVFSREGIGRILVIRIDRVGDVVLSTPVLKALRGNFPSAYIAFMVDAKNTGLLVNNPHIDRVIAFDRSNPLISMRQLRGQGFDLTVDLLADYHLKTAWMSFLSGARYRLGYDIAGRGVFFNLRLGFKGYNKHIIEMNLDLLRSIGINPADNRPDLFVAKKEKQYVQDYLSGHAISEGQLVIGMHPGSHFASQRWSPEGFSRLAEEAIRQYSAKVLLLGGPQEEGLLANISGLMRNKPLVISGISLPRLMAFISCCSVFVCNNSGPLHIACALNVPTVSTMGPTDPVFWWPVGDKHIVVRKNAACSPCSKAVCKRHKCLEEISVEDMLQAVDTQIKRLRDGK